MAVTNESLLVDIKVNTENASKGVEDLTKQLELLNQEILLNRKSTQSTEKSVTGFGSVMVKLSGFITVAKEAYNALSGGLKASVGEFLEAEAAMNRLASTLAINGQLSEEALKSYDSLAKTLQETTGTSDDLIISLAANAKAIGLSDAMTEKLIKTSIDLAAATGKDVAESFQGLTNTLKGNAKGLGTAAILVKDLSEESLRSGKAIEVLGQRFDGLGQAKAATLAGGIQSAKNAFSDLLEIIGDVAVNQLGLTKGIQAVIDSAKAMQKIIEENRDSFSVLGEAIGWVATKVNALVAIIMGGIVGAFQQMIATLSLVASWMGKLASVVGLLDKDKAQAIRDFADSMNDAAGVNFGAVREGVKDIAGFGDASESNTKKADAFKSKLEEVNKAAKETKKSFKEMSDEEQKFLEELIKKNEQLRIEILQSTGLQQDVIQKKYDVEIEALKRRADELQKNGKLDDRTTTALADQISLLEERKKLESAKAPSRDFEAMQKPLKESADSISRVFSGGLSGIGGAVTGFMSGAGSVVDAVQQLIDFIPSLLDKMTNVFKSLTDLPKRIADSIANLGSAIKSFVADFLPNMLKQLPNIVDSIISTIEQLPDIFIKMVESLPDLITKFIEKIPEFAERLASSLALASPRIAMAISMELVKNAPAIAMAFMKTVLVELPKSIIKGFIQGVKEFIGAIKSLFSGKSLAKAIFDPKVIAQSFQQIGRTLTGATSQMFNVSDLQDGLASAGDPIKQAVQSVTDELWDWLAEFKKVWKWIWEKILLPFINMLKAVWFGTFELLKTVWNEIMSILTATWDLITGSLRAVWDGITSIFNGVVTYLKTVWDTVMGVFTGKINLLDGVMKIGAATWKVVADTFRAVFQVGSDLFGGVANFFQAVFSGIVNSLRGVGDFFNGIWLAFKQNVIDPLASGFSWLGDFINTVNKLFEKPGWLSDLQGALGGGGDGDAPGGVLNPANWAKGGMVYAANGQMIPFVPRGTDTVPAMLTPGEFVVNRNAVNSLGVSAMNAINNGQLPQSSGGSVNVSLNIQTTEAIDESFVRTRLMPRIKEEMRRASLDGNFLLSAKGIR